MTKKMIHGLSERSRLILEAIAKGHTYEQILVQDLAFTYHDIFQAAAEALELAQGNEPQNPEGAGTYQQRVEKIRRNYPRAYENWDVGEDEQLRNLFASKRTIYEMAKTFQRQPGAIKSRLVKLELIDGKK